MEGTVKQHANTLFVTTQGAYVAREGDTVLVRVEKETRLRVPIIGLDGIVCFGRVGCSPSLLELCGRHAVTVSFLSQSGRFRARVLGPTSGNVLLRRTQYRRADAPDGSAEVARAIVAAKVANSRVVLQRSVRDHPENPHGADVEAAVRRLQWLIEELRQSQSLDRVRGIEGDAGRTYFSVFDHLITAQKEEFSFHGRSRRPPLDKVNALLSFLYAVAAHDATSALESTGLDPAVGFLHRDRPGRPGLALDLLEEFRAFLCDRLALSLINRRQVTEGGFTTSESGDVRMDDATRKTLLVAYQERKQEEIRHPFLQETTTVGLLMHLQARFLARFLRGDLDGYPPFLWK